jgi:CTP:molybdopterin cytidylyltransferase MocA
MNLAGLLLAAGGARRFGAPKLLANYRGETLVRRAAGLLVPRCPAGTVVVTGAHAAEVEPALAGLPVRCVTNANWSDGLAGSIRTGIAALPSAADACLLLLGDTPAVRGADLDALIAAWQVEPQLIAAAGFGGRSGPPVILPRAMWPELSALRGDQGARGLLEWHAELTVVPIPAAGLDVDTPADLARLEARPAH